MTIEIKPGQQTQPMFEESPDGLVLSRYLVQTQADTESAARAGQKEEGDNNGVLAREVTSDDIRRDQRENRIEYWDQ